MVNEPTRDRRISAARRRGFLVAVPLAALAVAVFAVTRDPVHLVVVAAAGTPVTAAVAYRAYHE